MQLPVEQQRVQLPEPTPVVQQPQCKYCYSTSYGTTTLKCGCPVHTECQIGYMKANLEKGTTKCISCQQDSQINDLVHLLAEEDREKFFKTQITKWALTEENIRFCPGPDCEFFYVADDLQSRIQALKSCDFTCPDCSYQYCQTCMEKPHEGNCDPKHFKLDPELEQYFSANKAMRCRVCKFYVEKSEGCDHMTCKCGHEFCLNCK